MKTNKKTITLGDDPSIVLCPGHVTQKVFNDAFKNEGWSERGGYKKDQLRYEYWEKLPPRRKCDRAYYQRSAPGKTGAKPYTVVLWD